MMVYDHASSPSAGPGDEDRYSCPAPGCNKTFVRKAHMLRHQQQHASQKPFLCVFCNKSFKRSDVLRAHQFRCKERGDAPVPEGQSKGRKRSSCASCVKLRTKCDQETPCARCVELGKDCVRAPTSHADPPRRLDLPRPKSREAIPIAHLLNSPPDDDFGRRFPVPDSHDDNDSTPNAPEGEDASEASQWGEPMDTYDSYTGPVQTTAFDSFFNGLGEPMIDHLFWASPLGPFGQQHLTETLTFNTSVMRSEGMHAFEPMQLGLTDPRLQPYEARANEVRQALQMTAATYGPTMPDPQDMLSLAPTINSLNASEVASLVDLFFQHYHKHCPIIHRASFDLTAVPLALLLAVLALGGMYAPDKPRVERMRCLLDVIELYIFNLDGLREEFPFSSDLSQAPTDDALYSQFQVLQGGYLIIVAQYFSGNLSAKRRARRPRFLRVLDVARACKLPSAQHPPFIAIHDEQSFQAWLRQENRIRHFNIMVAFDAAMAIFNNVPPRITFSEIDVALPCEQQYWEVGSYAELVSLQSLPQPRPMLMDMFQLLFAPTNDFRPVAEKINWNCWDMLYLVHLLYCHVWRQTFSNVLLRKSPYATPAPQNILEPLKTGIRNWKMLWDEIHSKLSQDQLRGMGFETSADSYWTLTKLILQAFDVNHVRSGTSYAASGTESAAPSSPTAEPTSASTATPGHHRQTSGHSNGRFGSPPNGMQTTNGSYGDYNAYNMVAQQAGMVPMNSGATTMNMNNNGSNYVPPSQRFIHHPPQAMKHEGSVVNASGLPPGLGLTGNYSFNANRGSGGNAPSEPTSATATEFGGSGALHDFIPLEADCDTQGAHLKKILRAVRQ